jgi:hypothetical protein
MTPRCRRNLSDWSTKLAKAPFRLRTRLLSEHGSPISFNSPTVSINPFISSLQARDFLIPFSHSPFFCPTISTPIRNPVSSTIMAIYSSVPPPSQHPHPTQAASTSIEIEAWTVSALQSLNISPSARGTGATLSIPLDSDQTPKPLSYKPRKEPLKRDSQKRREAVLKGKEGSRRRQRWENGKFRLTRYSSSQEEREAIQ